MQKFPTAAAVMLFFISFLVLAGWHFENLYLKSLFPGAATMKVNTAVGLLLCGACLLVLDLRKRVALGKVWLILPGLLAFLGLAVLIQYVFNVDLGIDQWIYRDTYVGPGTSHPGRMAPNTAVNFILFGTAFALLGRRTEKGIN